MEDHLQPLGILTPKQRQHTIAHSSSGDLWSTRTLATGLTVPRGVFTQLGPGPNPLHPKAGLSTTFLALGDRSRSCIASGSRRAAICLCEVYLPFEPVVSASSVATTSSTSPLMSFIHVPHAVVARSLMDADEVHHFSDSSRNTLIATAAVGKSCQSCSVIPDSTILSWT